MPETAVVWRDWFASWWASYWTPEYLSQITVAIRLYDSVGRGNLRDATELRQAMDGIGASFKGQQDRRWTAPKAEAIKPPADVTAGPYAGLRVVKTA
ncbi:MAG TPA: hypothetical protein VIM25_02425 [Candidatus Limnocylindrales bacterium]